MSPYREPAIQAAKSRVKLDIHCPDRSFAVVLECRVSQLQSNFGWAWVACSPKDKVLAYVQAAIEDGFVDTDTTLVPWHQVLRITWEAVE